MAISQFFKQVAAIAVGTITISLATAETALASTLTFDDLPEATCWGDVYVGDYGGLNWGEFSYLNSAAANCPYPKSGYIQGRVSGTNVAYNPWGMPAEITSDQLFDFIGVYLAGAWRNELQVAVIGLLDGVQKFSTTVTVNTTGSTWFNFNFTGINQLQFISDGGIDAGIVDPGLPVGTHFAMDNFTYEWTAEPVPEPTTVLGTLTLTGMLMAARRRHQRQQP